MKNSSLSRIATLCVALFSMLFMQLAVASYACPGSTAGGARLVEANTATKQVEMAHCEGMDVAQASLCAALAHGEAAKQSSDHAQLSDAPPFIPVELVQVLHQIDNSRIFARSAPRAVVITRSSAPPIAIRNCCFRI